MVNYKVTASAINIREKIYDVDRLRQYEPEYINIVKGPLINDLKKEAKAKQVFSRDPDREGEATFGILAYFELMMGKEPWSLTKSPRMQKTPLKNRAKSIWTWPMPNMHGSWTDCRVFHSPILWKRSKGLSAGRVICCSQINH